MDLKKLYRELVRRNVFRAVLAYLAVAWVLIEAASTILPTFGAPDYMIRGLIYLLSIGLVIWAGFSWVYDLTPDGIRKTPEEYDTVETRQMNSRRLNAVIVGSVIIAVLVLVAGSFWAGSKWRLDKVATAPLGSRIAVLPFEDRSDNAEYAYLSEGLAEDVISTLFEFSALSVISSRSAFQFKDTDKSIGEISRALNADIVLTGSYTITDQKVDVKVEIIDTEVDEILNYASIMGDLGHIRDISTQIGGHLQESLGVTPAEAGDHGKEEERPVNPEAFKLYSLGKSAMRDHTGQRLEDITKYFLAAIELDQGYADPYIGMAEAYIFDVNRGYISSTLALQKAREYALQAEKLNPGSGEVSGLLGIIHFLEFDFKNAVPYLEESIKKSPNFSLAYQWYSFILEYKKQFKEAEALQKKAGMLDPLNAFNDFFLILNYIYQHNFEQAADLINSHLSLDPDHKEFLWLQAVLLTEQGHFEEAHNVLLQREMGLKTNFVSGYVYAKMGREMEAREVLNNMLEREYVSPSQLAIVYCGLKEYDRALDQVERAYLTHDGWFKWVVLTSMTDPIRDDPRYTSLLAQLEL